MEVMEPMLVFPTNKRLRVLKIVFVCVLWNYAPSKSPEYWKCTPVTSGFEITFESVVSAVFVSSMSLGKNNFMKKANLLYVLMEKG